jgi:hypothetical protein
MILARDVEYHTPDKPGYEWAETNFFSFYVAERNLMCAIQTVTRPGLGVTLADVTIFDRLSTDRRDHLHINGQQHLPAPASLGNYRLANGLAVRATNAPRDYQLTYDGIGDTMFDLRFEALMDPCDLHAARQAENAASPTNTEKGDLRFYRGGHFDMTGRITGVLRIHGESIAVDCIDTMDHSWGLRSQADWGMTGAAWLHAHFGPDYVVHVLLTADSALPQKRQYALINGYVLEGGALYPVVTCATTAVRIRQMDNLPVALDLNVVDSRGKRHHLHGAAMSTGNLNQYPSLCIYHTLHRWISNEGRVGYGCNMEGSALAVALKSNQLLPV